jgi:hypothetical protein
MTSHFKNNFKILHKHFTALKWEVKQRDNGAAVSSTV